MNRYEITYFMLACIFFLFGLLALLSFLSDSQTYFLYGYISMGLLIPGGVLLLAAFQSKIKIGTNDPTNS